MEQVANAFFAHAYKLGADNRPERQTAIQFTRQQLDRLELGQDLTEIPWGRKKYKLPPSSLTR